MERNIIQFSEISKNISKTLSKETKKKYGVFFTPNDIIITILDYILTIPNVKVKNILEPSCGSCQFIEYCNTKYNSITIRGIEYNKDIYKEIQKIQFTKKNNNTIELIESNFITYKDEKKYDIIIGNPPYFVISKKDIHKKYQVYFDGRPNIYCIFILQSLELLHKNGILAFVLPKSFLNCLYYEKIRKYIIDNFTILTIIDHSTSSYIDTEQETCSIIIQNKEDIEKNNIQYTLFLEKYVIFTCYKEKIEKILQNSTNLHKLGFEVSVGNVVWNQVKNILTDDTTKTLLVYSGDITKNILQPKKYKNKEKKNYIHKKGSNEMLLVVNRGYGKGKYRFIYCLLDGSQEYVIENHLICIRYKKKIDNTELLTLYNTIITSFNNPKTTGFIDSYFENNAINTKELEYILPIYI